MDSTDYVVKEVIKELSGNVSCFSIKTEDSFPTDNRAAAYQKSKKLLDVLKVVPRWQDFFHNVLYNLQQSEEKYNCFYCLCLEERIIPLLIKVAGNDFHTYLYWAWGKYCQTDSYIAEDLNIHFEIVKLVEWKNDGRHKLKLDEDIKSLPYDCIYIETNSLNYKDKAIVKDEKAKR